MILRTNSALKHQTTRYASYHPIFADLLERSQDISISYYLRVFSTCLVFLRRPSGSPSSSFQDANLPAIVPPAKEDEFQQALLLTGYLDA